MNGDAFIIFAPRMKEDTMAASYMYMYLYMDTTQPSLTDTCTYKTIWCRCGHFHSRGTSLAHILSLFPFVPPGGIVVSTKDHKEEEFLLAYSIAVTI